MKRFLVVALILMGFTAIGFSATPVYDQYLVNGNVASTMTFTINNSAISGDYASFQANYTTPTYSPSSFIDGVKSTGTITIVTNAGVTGSTLTIQTNSYVEGLDWTHDLQSSGTAKNLYQAITSTYGARATGYLTVLSTYTLGTSTAAYFTMYGKNFTQGTDWYVGTASYTALAIKQTGQSIFNTVSSYFSKTVGCIFATPTITFTYNYMNSAGNSTMISYVSSITVSGMSGGKITPLASGTTFSFTTGSTVIYATATVAGVSGNNAFTSSVSTSMVVTGMSGGVNPQILYAPTSTIVSTQSYPAGLSVLLSASAGTVPTGLTVNTTYFVIPYNSTSIQLASTQANAIAGIYLPLTNSTLDRGTFILTPAGLTASMQWMGMVCQASNDGKNWWNLSVASSTIWSSTTLTTQAWDMSKYNWEYIRVLITPAVNTLGSAFIQIIGYITKIAQ